ncbi:MAG: MFS transporter [Candidatus Dormibacteraeota bacterium]|nr:MFS transporter [Candidatus Dormibacteraeota bacterium]
MIDNQMVSRDFWLIVIARLLRAFAFGVSAVVIGLYLERRGLSPIAIGVSLTIGLLAGALFGLAAAAASARIGRRLTLSIAGLLMAVTGIDLALASAPWLLGLAGVTGMLGAASVDLGPFASIEQAALAESVEPARRNLAFARYSLTGGLAVAVGAITSGWATTVPRSQLVFFGYALVGVVTAALALSLSSGTEPVIRAPAFARQQIRSLGPLSGLFALDALGGGLVVQAVIAYWLHVRFGAGASVLGPTFAAIALVQAASYELSGRLSNRIGLIRTMVFTHIPSNILLILIPLSPTLGWAIALLVTRYSLSQMDVPARQAYVASIVPPQQRAGALAVTGAVRGIAQAAGPVLSGIAIQGAALGFPFYLAGALKLAYDLLLYAGFRRRPAAHETVTR